MIDTINIEKMQPTEWEKICTYHISDWYPKYLRDSKTQ
jgi:hypothetical protein